MLDKLRPSHICHADKNNCFSEQFFATRDRFSYAQSSCAYQTKFETTFFFYNFIVVLNLIFY